MGCLNFCTKSIVVGVFLVIIVVFAGCANHHSYPTEFDYSYTLSNRNYTFAIYNNKHRLMTHPIRDLKLQMDQRKQDVCNNNSISDIYIVSHGWNYTATEAVANYHKYIELADEVLGDSNKLSNETDPGSCGISGGFQPFFIFVTWTSTTRPLSELSAGVFPLAIDNILHPITSPIDTVVFHIPSAWKQSLNAANNALGSVFPNHYLFRNWKTENFGTESNRFYIDEDYDHGRDLPLSTLIYELIKCKYPADKDITEESAKCLFGNDELKESDNLKDVNVHLIGHSYGGKLVAMAGIESLRRWMLVNRLKLPKINENSPDKDEKRYEAVLSELGHHYPASFEPKVLGCFYIGGCADETKATQTIEKQVEWLNQEKLPLPITSLVLFNPALHAGELWYSPRDILSYQEKAPSSHLRLIERKGIVYSKHDSVNGALFNVRELLLNTQVTQIYQQQVQTDFSHAPLKLLWDIPWGFMNSIVGGAALYVGTTLYNLPYDFAYHLQRNDVCWEPNNVNFFAKPLFWMANTVDFFLPFFCGISEMNIGPLRDEDRQGLFRLARPALGKTGLNKVVNGRRPALNLWGLDSFYSDVDEDDEGKVEKNHAEDISALQFCEFSYPKKMPLLNVSTPPNEVRESIYSFDASLVFDSFALAHSDLRETDKVSCDQRVTKPQEKRRYSFAFTYKFTKTDFWDDPALTLTP